MKTRGDNQEQESSTLSQRSRLKHQLICGRESFIRGQGAAQRWREQQRKMDRNDKNGTGKWWEDVKDKLRISLTSSVTWCCIWPPQTRGVRHHVNLPSKETGKSQISPLNWSMLKSPRLGTTHFPYKSMGTQVQLEGIKGATKYHGLSFILPKRCEAQQVLLLLSPFSKLLKEEDTRNDDGDVMASPNALYKG